MAKQNKSQPKVTKEGKERYVNGVPSTFMDRNIAAMPVTDANQMAPTPSDPVKQHVQMAGGC